MVATLMTWIETIMSTTWIYPLIGLLVFGDSVCPALPAEMPLNLIGAWAGSQGEPNLIVIFFIAVFAGILGDNVCFFAGTRLMPFINRIRRGSRMYGALTWVRRNMRRNAGAAIIVVRVIPSARLILTVLLGSVRYPWPAFFFFDTIGVMLWAAQALAIGYLGGVLFSGNPLIAMVMSVIFAIVIGFAIQRLQNFVVDSLDTRRGFAEAY